MVGKDAKDVLTPAGRRDDGSPTSTVRTPSPQAAMGEGGTGQAPTVALRSRPGAALIAAATLASMAGLGRTWVYARLHELAADGRATQISRGRWTVTGKPR